MEHLVTKHIIELAPKAGTLEPGNDVIRLDLSELPYAPSPSVVEAITNAASTMNRYPHPLGDPLRQALAEYTGTRKEQIFLGNGSDDLIELVVKTFVDRGEHVLIPTPTFFMYWHATRVMGGNPIFVNRTEDFGLDVDALLREVGPHTKAVFIANPNNPTANLIPREVLLELLNKMECMVVVDECYYEMCLQSVVDLLDQYPNLIVLRSFSKSFGLAGLRLGYGVANEVLVSYLYRATQPFPVNTMAQLAALAALTDLAYVHSNIERICQEKENLARSLGRLGLHVYPSVTNFLFVCTRSLRIPSSQLVEALRKKSIFVQDFGLKPGSDAYHFRTSVGTPSDNRALLAGIEEVIVESVADPSYEGNI